MALKTDSTRHGIWGGLVTRELRHLRHTLGADQHGIVPIARRQVTLRQARHFILTFAEPFGDRSLEELRRKVAEAQTIPGTEVDTT